MSSPRLSRGFSPNQAKPQVNRHFFSSMVYKLFFPRTSCGSLQGCRCTKKTKLIRQDIWSLIRQKKSDAMPCYLQGIRRYHNRNVQERSFSIGDLVLRCISQAQLVMGRAFHHHQSYTTRVVSVAKLQWPGDTKLLEHRAPMPFLSLDNLYTKLSAAAQLVYQ
jgi:hypothetical protein